MTRARWAAVTCAVSVLTACTEPGTSGNCDRACLEGFVDAYLDALVARDPTRLKLADDVTFVENNQVLELGQGTWRTITGLGKYRHYFADVAAGQAGLIGVVEENGTKIIYDLRLKIEGRSIKEIEALAIRDPNGAALYEERGQPHAKFLESIPVEQRLPRAQLIATADKYLAGMQRNDPNGDYSFFHDDCDRWEHARETTNQDPEAYGHSTNTVFVTLGCREQFETGFLGFVTRIRDRRYMIIDEERQTVFGLVMLDHNGTIRSIPLRGGDTFVVPPYFSSPRTLQVGEAWRIEDGKLRQIEMTLTEFPYGTRPKFATGDDWLADEPPPGPASTRAEPVICDRLCLDSFMNQFLVSVLRREPEILPGWDQLRYTENGQRLAVGDGLWSTMTAVGAYRVLVADPATQTSVFVGSITETDVEGLLFARLKLDAESVGEIETFVVRHEFTGPRGGTLTLFAPRLTEPFDPEVFASADAAYGIMLNPLTINDPGELAAQAAAYAAELPTPGAVARERRVWVSDAARGVVVDLAVLDVANADVSAAPADASSAGQPATSTGPYSVMEARLYKILDGQVAGTELARVPVPYGMPSGW